MKIVINKCYSESFDISTKAKDYLRQNYGIIFDPDRTPRNDPALVKVIETLGEEAAIYHEDTGKKTYLSKPVIEVMSSQTSFSINSNYGFESIQCYSKKRKYDETKN